MQEKMLVDKFQFVLNVLKGTSFILAAIDGDETVILLSEGMTNAEASWLESSIHRTLDQMED